MHIEVVPPPRIPKPPGPPNCTQQIWVDDSHVAPPQAMPPPLDPELLPDVDPEPLPLAPPLLLDPEPLLLAPELPLDPEPPPLDPEAPLDVELPAPLLDSEPPLDVEAPPPLLDSEPPPDPDPAADPSGGVPAPELTSPVPSSSCVRDPHPSARSAVTVQSVLTCFMLNFTLLHEVRCSLGTRASRSDSHYPPSPPVADPEFPCAWKQLLNFCPPSARPTPDPTSVG